MEARTVSARGRQTHYKVFGNTGAPMLILHGWGSEAAKWEHTAQLLSQGNMLIVIPDLPGFGNSEQPQVPWNIDQYVEWVKDFCEGVPELNGDFFLLGHSFGGAVAAKFSIKYAQRVRKLFLLAAAAIRKKTLKKQALERVSKVVKIFAFLPFYPLARKAFYRFIVKGNDYLKAEGVMKETFMRAIADDLSQKLSFIKVPVVILWGDKDETTLIEDAYWINKKIPKSTLVIISGADHAPYLHMPEALAQKILAYA